MGGALLNGWLTNGLAPEKISVFEPKPSNWLKSLVKTGLDLNPTVLDPPAVCIIAVKPTMISELLSQNIFMNMSKALFVSIAAGVKLKHFKSALPSEAPIVRVMPNTPATIAKSISCLIANENVTEDQLQLIEDLFSTVGKTIRLRNENQMDVVTAISGSGPAYVFYLIEVLSTIGGEFGLSPDLANQLAVLTVSGSGALAEKSDLSAEQLRRNVTSPNGTTEAALELLMEPGTGLLPLMRGAVLAASERSKELGS